MIYDICNIELSNYAFILFVLCVDLFMCYVRIFSLCYVRIFRVCYVSFFESV